MIFYISTYDQSTDTEGRASLRDFASREDAAVGMALWLDELGARDTGRYHVKCELDDGDRALLRRVPDPSEMMRSLQVAGPEAVHRAARVNGFTALLNVMGATNEYGSRLVDGEGAIIRCALCTSAPYYEFWGRQFLPSFKRLDDGLKSCVLAAMGHI